MRLLKTTAAMALALGLAGCGGLLGGGKPPATLFSITPDAAEPASIARSSAPGQAVTIGTPAVARELGTVRVPVQVEVEFVACAVAWMRDDVVRADVILDDGR